MELESRVRSTFAVVDHRAEVQVAVYGLGYIGLPTSLALVAAGARVSGIDVNPKVIEALSSGRCHIQEEGVQDRLERAIASGRLEFGSTPCPSDTHIIAVPTPTTADHRAEMKYVRSAAESIATVLRPGDLVVVESTVPPGTCEKLVAPIIEQRTGYRHGEDYDLAHCPERVIPGRIFKEIVENDRVIGGTTPKAAARAAELYRLFVTGQIVRTDAATAELVKLMENTFRDVNIALANEFAGICEDLGADVHEAIELANRHPRVQILDPGIGVGGHCIPVDPWFIVEVAPDRSELIRMARGINVARARETADRIIEFLQRSEARSAAFLGLAYKADVDDFRESPAVEIVRRVRDSWPGEILLADSLAESLPGGLDEGEFDLRAFDEAVADADVVIPLVAHREVREIDPRRLESKAVFDPAGIWRSLSLTTPIPVRTQA